MTGLLAESEDVDVRDDQEDDLDGLFDDDNDEEEYKEESSPDVVSELFGDVDDIEDEEKTSGGPRGGASENLDRSKEDLQGLSSSSGSVGPK